MDSCKDGIKGKINILDAMLKEVDRPVWKRLQELNINPQFYGLRWIMLYLTQEFELFDVLRLWDAMIPYKIKSQFVIYMCIGILELIRD